MAILCFKSIVAHKRIELDCYRSYNQKKKLYNDKDNVF